MSKLGPRVWFGGNGADIVQMDSQAQGLYGSRQDSTRRIKKTRMKEEMRQHEVGKHTRHEGCMSTGVEKIQVVEMLSQLAILAVTGVSCARV